MDNPCAGCPWGAFPLCAHNLPDLRRIYEQGADPGLAAFLSTLIADLEPLAATPPAWGREPPAPARPRNVGFGTLGSDPGRPLP